MHYSLRMHFLKSSQQTKHELFDFIRCKMTIFFLNFMKELASSQKIKDNIDWVIWLINSFKS